MAEPLIKHVGVGRKDENMQVQVLVSPSPARLLVGTSILSISVAEYLISTSSPDGSTCDEPHSTSLYT
ncbi:hypothetical protein SeMB42_g00715 [Synchytrium endobioticum]|uniref:Uncharacterized protein n=1 Tax=Synchytrium endobioticum TaxID=286115 RepID=A0A507DQ74_9FUNG|nr:hypothetical protein SeMB42_g00715 [Synchytrium endobioticum]